jgi:hypothetical protein
MVEKTILESDRRNGLNGEIQLLLKMGRKSREKRVDV